MTDSALTNHGVLQANRLGTHLAATDVKISHIFSSHLQRAYKTAEAVRAAQSRAPESVTQLQVLREQDFGFYEGKKFFERPKDSDKSGKDAHLEARKNEPGFQDMESKESMRVRVDNFIDGHLLRLWSDVQDDQSVVVVAHGIILSHLWRAILKRFHLGNVAAAPGVVGADRGLGLEYLGEWSNTGYLDLEIKHKTVPAAISQSSSTPVLPTGSPSSSKPSQAPAPAVSLAPPSAGNLAETEPVNLQKAVPSLVPTPPGPFSIPEPQPMLQNMSLVVKAVNSQEHVRGLKKTRGGIGSSAHDSSQKTMESFFKRRKIE